METTSMTRIRQALEASWRPDTAYLQASEKGNPALGNCYPTARVVQHYFPDTEIVEGQVKTPNGTEKHFWNILVVSGVEYHIDLTWQQFPAGSYVETHRIRDRHTLNDDTEAVQRVDALLSRVQKFLTKMSSAPLL